MTIEIGPAYCQSGGVHFPITVVGNHPEDQIFVISRSLREPDGKHKIVFGYAGTLEQLNNFINDLTKAYEDAAHQMEELASGISETH